MKTESSELLAFFDFDYKHSDFWAALIVCCGGGALALTLALEHVFNLHPCALCLTQRYFMFLGIFVAILSLTIDSRLGILPVLSILAFLVGIGFALRHVGLIVGIFDSSSCTAPVDYLLENDFPANDLFKALSRGSMDCTEGSKAIPFLAIGAFVVFIGMAIQQFRLGPRSVR